MRFQGDRGGPPGTPGRFASAGRWAGVVALVLAVSGAAHAKPAEGRRPQDLTGQLLVATNDMKDPRFARTVIFVVHHDASGALGLIVNRPLRDVPIALLMDGLGLERGGVSGSMPVHHGGPVEPRRVFVLHSTDYKTGDTQVIAEGIGMTTPSEILPTIGTGAGPRRAFLVLGYSGWTRGQLDEEIRDGSWLVAPAEAGLVFDEDYDTTWQRVIALRKRGSVDL